MLSLFTNFYPLNDSLFLLSKIEIDIFINKFMIDLVGHEVHEAVYRYQTYICLFFSLIFY